MMDFAGGVNPDCFARGLIKEALRQMGNLQRRKASMRMLAITIQNGMNEREKQLKILASLDEKLAAGNSSTATHSGVKVEDGGVGETLKRKREEGDGGDEPAAKR